MMILLLTIAFISVFFGAVVAARNPSSAINQSFFGMTFMGALWITSNAVFPYLPEGVQYADALLSYSFVGLFITFFAAFALELTNNSKFTRPIVVAGALLSAVSAFPGLIATDVINGVIQTTPALWFYAVWFTAYSVSAVTILMIGRKKVSDLRRQRIEFLVKGVVVTFIGAGFFNLILPLTGNYNYVLLGPAFSIVFIAFFTYSVMRHRLFDIKKAIARVVAYILSVALLGGALGYIGYVIYSTLDRTKYDYLIFIGIGGMVAVSFPVVKLFFDRITREIFLAGEYDIQRALDTIGAGYASATSVASLEKKNNQMLTDILHASRVVVEDDIEGFKKKFPIHSKTVISIDAAEDEHQYDDIVQFMREESYAIIAPLIVNRKLVGYLILGDKRNGAGYSRHDLQFIDIVSDELAVALQGAQRLEEIRRLNADLQSRVNDATTELRDSNKKLRELDETKDEFISMASHQLRTPLTSVKGYISMLLDGDMGELKPAQRQVLEEAYGSSQRMVYLIGDFLNLSRLRTGKFVIERAPVSLPKIIAEEINQLREAARHKDIALSYDSPVDFPLLMLDETKIRQVMMNFIDNAIYYSKPTGGKIEVRLIKHANHITFKVSDNGIGVPAKERNKLFTKFYRAENARRARPDGTGVGLFMAKKVVVALGGAILFETKENEGSTFGFRLPLDEINKVK